jgi:hypothetical protein
MYGSENVKRVIPLPGVALKELMISISRPMRST